MLETNIRLPPKWIELNITRTECSTFIATPDEPSLCQCGRKKIDHADFTKHQHRPETWSPRIHTKVFNTDAYGTVVFEGEHHPNKAHYVRLSYDTNPEIIIQLMSYVWNLKMPQLLISVRGGSSNFEMPSRLGKIFQTGLIKAARSTNAWIFSNGLNSGVAKHLGNALSNEKWIGGLRRGRVTAVGIASWGMVENREELIGRNKERTYNPLDNTSKFLHLNPRHSNFLLVDNGSTGKFGGENYLRRRLEKCVESYPISLNRGCDTPVVVIVLEGGFYTLRQVSDYLHDEPPIPVVIFAGTGRSADLISFVVRNVPSDEDYNGLMREKIYLKISQLFHVNNHQCLVLYKELRNIFKKRNLISVYNPNSTNEEDFDAVILSSIFRSQHWSPLQQLSLTLVWNRVDIAQNEVFIYGREWSSDQLEHAMMEALVSNRIDFVNLLLEHGINMQTFLTASRLEALYSLERISSKLLRLMLMGFSKVCPPKTKLKTSSDNKHGRKRNLTLHDIGVARKATSFLLYRNLTVPLENWVPSNLMNDVMCIRYFVVSQMIGHVYQSSYIHLVAKIHKNQGGAADDHEIRAQTFLQPFDDLFLWAVLTKRHEMSKLLWRHGKGALAKALIAVKLNRYIAREIIATEKTFTSSLATDFENYAEDWENISVLLLDSCYRTNAKMARQLLTMELESWSKQTCLTLAVMANHRTLLGHSCCQILLADLWMGALNIKSNTSLKIVLGILFPPLVFCWEYKSTEELKLLPHQEKTVHSYGTYSTIRMNRDLFADLEHGDYQDGPELKARNSLGQNMYVSNNARTTDLAIVARSIFPIIEEENNALVEVGGEDSKIGSSDQHQFPHSQCTKAAERGTEMSHSHFRFKSRNVHQLVDFGTGTVAKKFDRSSFVTTQQSLGLGRKFVEFQTAPITNYIRHTIGYLVFLMAIVYVCLFKQNRHSPGWVEWYVIAYFVTHFLECIREFIHIDALNMAEKVEEMQNNFWQYGDIVVVSACLGAVGLRLSDHFDYAMLIIRTSSIYWNLRLYKYLQVHRFIGPKISMMQRMLNHMVLETLFKIVYYIHLAMITVVVIISFGIARKSIKLPNTNPTFRDLAEVFLEPYMMMFGEVEDLESLSAHCGTNDDDGGEITDCYPGYWIVPIAWTAYMLVSNILIINVIIAVFNRIYTEVDAIAVEVWMFQRFNSVMEFEQKPILPPPFIIICHVISIITTIYESFITYICEEELLLESQLDEDVHPHIIMGNDHSLKSFLSHEEQSMVFDFEEENIDNLAPLLGKEVPNGSNGWGSTDDPNGNIAATGSTVANRLGIASNNFAVQQMKLIIGELHSELECQKAKLDKLINCWEIEIASSNPEDTISGSESTNQVKGSQCPVCSIKKNISTTSSIDEFS